MGSRRLNFYPYPEVKGHVVGGCQKNTRISSTAQGNRPLLCNARGVGGGWGTANLKYLACLSQDGISRGQAESPDSSLHPGAIGRCHPLPPEQSQRRPMPTQVCNNLIPMMSGFRLKKIHSLFQKPGTSQLE